MTSEAPAQPGTEPFEAALRHVPLPPIGESLLRRTQGGGASWDDARRHPRFATAAKGHLQVDRPDPAASVHSQSVLLRDLSRSGLRFLHGAELFPGDLGSIQFASGPLLKLRVVWCRSVDRGVFMSGCSFRSKPSAVEHEALAEPSTDSPGD